MNSNRNYIANREYKSTVFSKLFGEDKENALSLYNAVNNSNYTNADDLIFTTLEDVVYMKMKNDVSFLFDKYRYEPGAFEEVQGIGRLCNFC